MSSSSGCDPVVDLWLERLDRNMPKYVGSTHVGSFLSDNESQRAGTFVIPRVRDRFVFRRGLLRMVLAQHLGVTPQSLAFDATCRFCGSLTHGKPRVIGYPHTDFSTSSSGDLVAIAIGDDNEVGVDIECLDAIESRAVAGLISSAFVESERAYLDISEASATHSDFVAAFVLKEALGKADGHGLFIDISTIAHRWSVQSLCLPHDHVGVLASRRPAHIEYHGHSNGPGESPRPPHIPYGD